MTKLEKISIFNILFMAVVLIFDIIYAMPFTNNPYIFKTIPSALFVVGGIINFIFAKREGFENKNFKFFSIFMLIGLVFAMMGDILLIDLFEIGAGVFGIGHIMFFVAYLYLSKFKIRDLICFISIFIPSLMLILFYPGFTYDGFMKILVIVYALIISLMLGKAFSNVFDKELPFMKRYLIFIGSLLFFISDLCLLFYCFTENPLLIYDNLCLITYYPAVTLLATTIYYASRKNTTTN